MHARNKNLVGICSYNEGDKIRRVIERFNNYNLYDVLIIDDASSDGSIDRLPLNPYVAVIRNKENKGAGYGTRQIIEYAKNKSYEVIIFAAGNDKDDPQDVVKLLTAIYEGGNDFVQGSRYLSGGEFGNMPFYRRVATRIMHPRLFSLISGMKITDSTNGFRATRMNIYSDSRIDLSQEWLDRYELEPYLFYKVIKLGYKVTEVPVRKIYPPHKEGYTKMRPFIGWWSILRPLVFLALGIKK